MSHPAGGLTLVAHRDRISVGVARERWSGVPVDPDTTLDWRKVSGRRSRQLLRTIAHTDAVQGFLAALAEQARSRSVEVVQLDPPRMASRYFQHDGRLATVSLRPSTDRDESPMLGTEAFEVGWA